MGAAGCSSDEPEGEPKAPAAAGSSPTPTPTPTQPRPGVDYHPFTGGKTGMKNRVLAVKIDNTRPAHPQEGLRSADIVYVEQVEGGETRIMAIFSSHYPKRIGPVRSARISDLHILRQFGKPALAFSGVQSKMKPLIRKAPLYDISQDNGGSAYYRYSGGRPGGRSAPYNLFGDVKGFLKQAPRASRPKDIGFRFGPAPSGGKPLKRFTAHWPAEKLTFTWSAKEKRWLTSHNGQPNGAVEGGVLGGRTVVIQYVRTSRSRFHDFLGSYTPYLHTVGKGRAVVLRDGKAWECTWSRPREEDGTTFKTKAGERMTFAPGQVWVAIVNDGKPFIP
ncbi:DUF3048 domain-containing protein [Actinocorallia longicatena]|uniref:DUF3048 domain-containing protein n=1 Tax=Actinocorallia longicatena TaxID=111803 RepID=UPI0031DDEDE6